MYFNLLKQCLTDNIYNPDERNLEGKYWPKRAHTMIGLKRLNNIQELFEDIIKNKIEGDLVETGVWKGGACIFMNALIKYYKEERKVYVCDSFEGLPKPDLKYLADKNSNFHTFKELAIDLQQVKDNFEKYDLLTDNVIFVKGFFEETMKTIDVKKITILRLDGDMYSSTIQVLEALYDRVSEGGYIIIDDYGCVEACKQAVDDFRKERNIINEIIKIDWAGIYWRK